MAPETEPRERRNAQSITKARSLEVVVTKRRDKRAASNFHRKLMKRYGLPQEIVTDRFQSYRAALRDLGSPDLHVTGRWLNNRVENSHLPMR